MMLDAFINRAEADEPVYIGEVREAFQREGVHPLSCHVTLYGGGVRRFPLRLPDWFGQREEAFVASYLHAMLYNILSSLGAERIDLYTDQRGASLAAGLDAAFQTGRSKAERNGYGKCLNVNERTLQALYGDARRFSFRVHDAAEEPPVTEPPAVTGDGGVFRRLPAAAAGRMVMGMDIGGTDIKLVAAVDGKLAVFKEFDWFPAGFTRAEQLVEPVLLLTRLMRAAASLCAAGRREALDAAALERGASVGQVAEGVRAMEAAAGAQLRDFDAIGLCFPDVVIRNRIVGGETYKTRGMRENPELDYEAQFAEITGLADRLAAYVTPDGAVMNTNDGPMAAFTTAVEQAAAGRDVSSGFFAHTLGTELGTGWVRPDGTIPEIPLEVYNFIVDLGSFGQRAYEADDVRSVNNFNTGLPGTLQKYACQSGVFRLAARELPKTAPQIWQEAVERGLFVWEGGKLTVPTAPQDLRKPCLEFFMEKAEAPGGDACAELFRKIGESLGACWTETAYILQPESRERTLFGRLVKSSACFRLLCEGAGRIVPELQQHAADGSLANTPLMRQLEAHPDYTVAQFAQAVGAVYFGCLPFAGR